MTENIVFFSFLLILLLLLFYIKRSFFIKIYPIKDIPTKRKLHKRPVALIGGIFLLSYFTLFLFFFNFIFQFNSFITDFVFYSVKDFIYFLIILIAFIFIGIIDDKFSISPFKKVFFYVVLLFFLIFQNELLQIKEIKLDKILVLIDNSKIIFTTLFLLVLIVSMNLFDGINLQTNIFYIILFTFLSYHLNSFFIFLFFIPPLLLFSILNSKNEAFFGEAGVNILVLFSGILLVKAYNVNYLRLGLDINYILSFFLLPILDSCRLFLVRSFYFANPFRADKNHIHHKLLKKFGLINSLIFLNFQVLFTICCYYFNINSFIVIFISSIYYILLIRLTKKSFF